MLKLIRRVLAVLSILCITLLFVDFTGTSGQLFGWLASIQFIPALLSVSVVSLLILLAITLLFGRVYCSVICPLGILQDVFSRFRYLMPHHRPFRYTPARTTVRIIFLGLFASLFILGLTNLVSATLAGLIEPYAAYGRIASSIFAPIYDAINNAIVDWDDDELYSVMYEVHRTSSTLIWIIAVVTLCVMAASAWFTGRGYCNTVCPVGTIFGYLSKFSLLRPVIDRSKCRECGKCASRCKASCIDSVTGTIDYTRCVTCMDCISTCPDKAISYTTAFRRKPLSEVVAVAPEQEKVTEPEEAPVAKKESAPADPSRRLFIATGALVGAALASKAAGSAGAMLDSDSLPEEIWPVSPPGAMSTTNHTSRCIGCQLCVSACPSGILKPSTEFGTLMVPFLDFSQGFCRPECNKCGEVCPTGAINLLDLPTKSSTRIGYAVVDYNACISASTGRRCKACERNCPTGAIITVQVGNKKQPMINPAICIGCGSCEFHCPTGRKKGSVKAIYVEGSETHQTI